MDTTTVIVTIAVIAVILFIAFIYNEGRKSGKREGSRKDTV